MKPPKRKQKQNTQSATAGSKNKNKNKTPMFHVEVRISLVEVQEATVHAASAFSSVWMFQVLEPCRWDPLTAIAWKRVIHFQFYKQAHPPEPELVKAF